MTTHGTHDQEQSLRPQEKEEARTDQGSRWGWWRQSGWQGCGPQTLKGGRRPWERALRATGKILVTVQSGAWGLHPLVAVQLPQQSPCRMNGFCLASLTCVSIQELLPGVSQKQESLQPHPSWYFSIPSPGLHNMPHF